MSDLIVVGLDGSETSTRALDVACTLASPQGKLLLIHVIDWSPFVIETFEENEYRGAIRKQQLEKAQTEVVDPAVAQVKRRGVGFEAETLFGSPAEEIVRVAKENDARMIVIGKTGTSRLERLMFGSKANKVIQVAEIPVVVVP